MESTKGKRIYSIVVMIGILMLLNIFLIRKNGQNIEENQEVLINARYITNNAEEIVQNLHLLDLGIRGYALTGKLEMYQSPYDTATARKNEAFNYLVSALQRQNFSLDEFIKFRQSVDSYFKFVSNIADQVQQSNLEEAQRMIAEDRGFPVWKKAKEMSTKIAEFEKKVEAKASRDFKNAVQTTFWLQLILFLGTMPTLIYAAIYSTKAISLTNRLRNLEKDKAKILSNQKEKLELLVRERTDEILAQNEEITAQNEEITSQNDLINSHIEEMSNQQALIEEKNEVLSEQNELLNYAKATIEKQQKLLMLRNEELTEEVAQQNEHLKQTNIELVDQINKLEEFGYIVSHNLRAPTARLLGLGNLFHKTDREEKESIVEMMIQSSKQLHEVINDMSQVLLVQKPGSKTLEQVDLSKSFEKVKNILSQEIERTNAEIFEEWGKEKIVRTLPLYIESILYNLISNAIKYHDKSRNPIIKISSYSNQQNIIIEVEDNGMGIDLNKYGEKLFGLYKRFHFHVEGKGLGLYLVKSQVEALGGKIGVESQIGQGTKFIVFLRK
jgi:signal transduction histidine kinase